MNLPLTASRLLPGTRLEGDVLLLPAASGGLCLPEIRENPQRYLNLEMELDDTDAKAFELRLYADGDAPRVIIRFGLNPRFHAAFPLDLTWMDGHILFPGHPLGLQKIVCHGSRIRREDITRAELVSMPAAHDVRLHLYGLSLSDTPLPPILPSGEKQIDAFGQYKGKTWEGKTVSEEEMVSRLRGALLSPGGYPFGDWSVYGGCTAFPLTGGTGFFSRVRRDGRWYLTDPLGNAFFSMGPDCVVARCDARIDGLEPLLDPLPPREGDTAFLYAEGRRDFGENGRQGLLFSYERWNLLRAFGKDWESAWQSLVTGQLRRMGMNTLGNWSDPALFGKMPYVTSLPAFPETRLKIFRDFPDVFSPEYEENARVCAEALRGRRDDPWMIGYFLRNEPAWAFVDNLILADEVLRTDTPSACREALIGWLRGRYGTADALSAAWDHPFSSLEDLRVPLEKASALSPQAREDLRTFSAKLVERYMRIPADACRAVDPNHMILGMRWAWISDPLLVTGWDCFDVFSINCYAVDPTPALERVRELGVDLPVMIGEFHFGASDSGLPATGLEAVSDQAQRALAYRYYTERVAAHPQGVGCHWFQCYDQFALGRFDGENYNIGLFDITLRPYEEMVRASLACASRVYAIHALQLPPTEEKPVSLPMIAY